MAVGDRLNRIITTYDKRLTTAEDATLKRIYAALDSAYKSLERDLIRSYQRHSDNKSLVPSQRKLLIMDEIKQYLTLIDPANSTQYVQAFESLVQQASALGIDVSGQMVEAIANEQLQSFATVPIEVVRAQAEGGMQRLSRHTQEFASQASAIVEMGLAQGWGSRRVADVLRQELKVTKSKAETIARTESMSALNAAAQQNYKENGLDWVQVFGTLDSRVCRLCASRNQKVYKLGDVMVPFHPKCRCYLVGVKRAWLEAGLIDTAWSQKFREDTIAAMRQATGKEPDNGLSPFEKYAKLSSPPKAVWEPGQSAPVREKPQRSTLPQNHVVSLNPRYSTEAFDSALDQIQSEGASDRVQLFRQFVRNEDLQIVVYDESLPQSKQIKLFKDSLKYQGWVGTDRSLPEGTIPRSGEDGFTSALWRHVAIRTYGEADFIPKAKTLQASMDEVFQLAANGDDPDTKIVWAIGSNSRNVSDGEFAVYLHEMGHQVHYKIGRPLYPEEVAGTLTDYGGVNSSEWFAEHFAAWMLDAEGYRTLDPVGAAFIEDSLKQAVAQPKRKI